MGRLAAGPGEQMTEKMDGETESTMWEDWEDLHEIKPWTHYLDLFYFEDQWENDES